MKAALNKSSGCSQSVYSSAPRLDDANRYRVDDLELDPSVQRKVEEIWEQVTEENLFQLTDFEGYKTEFLRLFGFGLAKVDYDAETTPLVQTNF